MARETRSSVTGEPTAAGTPETRGVPAADGPPATPDPQEPAAAEERELAPSEPVDEPQDIEALATKAQKADEYLELAQRTKADFENFRKRASRDAAIAQERGIAKLAKELLPAVDNLERALAHAPQAGEPEVVAFLNGIEHLHTDLIGALARTGIERYSPEGEPFDPQHHEAVAQAPVEGAQPGTVVEVYQRGYRFGELVLRPARVLVAA
jgi:molecular chaperone GrpE